MEDKTQKESSYAHADVSVPSLRTRSTTLGGMQRLKFTPTIPAARPKKEEDARSGSSSEPRKAEDSHRTGSARTRTSPHQARGARNARGGRGGRSHYTDVAASQLHGPVSGPFSQGITIENATRHRTLLSSGSTTGPRTASLFLSKSGSFIKDNDAQEEHTSLQEYIEGQQDSMEDGHPVWIKPTNSKMVAKGKSSDNKVNDKKFVSNPIQDEDAWESSAIKHENDQLENKNSIVEMDSLSSKNISSAHMDEDVPECSPGFDFYRFDSEHSKYVLDLHQLFLFQFPPSLPAVDTAYLQEMLTTAKQTSNVTPMKLEESSHVKEESQETARQSLLPTAPQMDREELANLASTALLSSPHCEGKLGRLKLYQSGKAELVIGDTRFQLSTGLRASFLQSVVSLNAEKQEAVVLGDIHNKFIASLHPASSHLHSSGHQ